MRPPVLHRCLPWIAPAIGLAAIFAWAWWPTIGRLVSVWQRIPDYSHGFLVLPIALAMAWTRRDSYPTAAQGNAAVGLALIAGSVVVRLAGARIYLDVLDAWAMLLWLVGAVWLFGGGRFVRWAAPSLAFLAFAIPLPFRVERWLSLPLQSTAARAAAWGLQFFGRPAVAEGNTIRMGLEQLEVEQACCGLRIFVGIVALAFAYTVFARRSRWETALLLLASAPAALAANAARIVAIGMFPVQAGGETARQFIHDISGWAAIPFAAAMFALGLWWLDRLLPPTEPAAGRP